MSCNRVFEADKQAFIDNTKCKLLALFVSANILTTAEFSIDFCVYISNNIVPVFVMAFAI